MTFEPIAQIILADSYVRVQLTDHCQHLMEDVFWFLQLHARQCLSIFHYNNIDQIMQGLATLWTVVW